ncbi:hypothetical protein HDU85_004141 [Gaertneriomyces sp. JEL0708]|nr:hypothetical protein HDU85_004141 [Gaertneriomyces sp. JEL0708]
MDQLMSHMEKVTPDGGIVKILIRKGDPSNRPNWVRGANARFHYAVYTYGREPGAKGHHHDGSCEHELNPTTCDHDSGKDDSLNGVRPQRRKVDDTREDDPAEPFELRIGYSFAVKAMETCIQTMTVGEKARFLCLPEYCQEYVQLAKVRKQEKQNRLSVAKGLPPVRSHGCCAHALAKEMETQDDLADVHGVPLEFEFELLEVQLPGNYVREPWEMEATDKWKEIPIRKEEGGKCFKEGNYKEALEKYTRALALLESLSLSSTIQDLERERTATSKKKDVAVVGLQHKDNGTTFSDVIELDTFYALMQACRLNYASCQLKLGNYPPVIAQCSEVLKRDPRNLKALFRRGQAYVHIGRDLELAEQDLAQVRAILEKNADMFAKNGPEWLDFRRQEQSLAEKFKAYRHREKLLYSRMFE